MAVGDEQMNKARLPMRRRPLSASLAAGFAALAFLAVLAGVALIGLAWQAAGQGSGLVAAFDPYLWRVARFTLVEAGLSTLLSVVPAIAVAVALNALPRFRGRGLVLRLFALPLALPALVAVFGVTGVYGQHGWLAEIASVLGSPSPPDIYGLTGIIIAHVFFNLPLASRLFLTGLASVPAEYWRISSQLGMGPLARFRLIEWPAMRRAAGGVAALVFMLCATSFTVVLTLGGGPKATTLEVAIYQALHFDFDAGRAVALTAVQLFLTGITIALIGLAGRPSEEGFSIEVRSVREDRPPPVERTAASVLIAATTLFVLLPLASVLISGFSADLGKLLRQPAVWRAVTTSIVIGIIAGALSVALSLALVAARQAQARGNAGRRGRHGLEWLFASGAGLILVIPPIVIGAGWFVLAIRFADPYTLAPFMVVTVNAAMAMPFAVRVLRPAFDTAAARHDRLCAALGISGLSRLRLIDLPALGGPLAAAFAFSMALSLGDLGTIALFGSDRLVTLPFLLLQRMSSYRTSDAAGLALILAILSLALIAAADRSIVRERSQ